MKNISLHWTKLLVIASALVAISAIPSLNQNSINDEAQIEQLSEDWIQAWSPQEDAENFNFMEHFSDFYAEGNDLILFDNADPQARIASSAEEYGNIWDGLLPNLSYVDNRITSEPKVYLDGDIAVSTMVWETTFTSSDGKEQKVPTLGTLVWQRTPQGWRIVHEHGTALSDESGGAGS